MHAQADVRNLNVTKLQKDWTVLSLIRRQQLTLGTITEPRSRIICATHRDLQESPGDGEVALFGGGRAVLEPLLQRGHRLSGQVDQLVRLRTESILSQTPILRRRSPIVMQHRLHVI